MITTMDTLLIALVLLLLGSQLVLFHKLRKVHLASYRLLQAADETFSLFQQFQSYDSLMRLIEPARPLPALRRWAASPDLLLTLAKEVLDRKPEAILECSSGSTTLVLARCCQLNSSGHVTSLEHDEKFAIQTREWLAEHGLERWATVIHAPLRPTGKTGQPWYDLSHLEIPENGFDMLVIDGPPASVSKHARYPAIPNSIAPCGRVRGFSWTTRAAARNGKPWSSGYETSRITLIIRWIWIRARPCWSKGSSSRACSILHPFPANTNEPPPVV